METGKKVIIRESRNFEYTETAAETAAAGPCTRVVVSGWEERVVKILMDAADGKTTRQEHMEGDEPGAYVYPVSVEVKTGEILGGEYQGTNDKGRRYSGTRRFFRARIVSEPIESWGSRRQISVRVEMLMENRGGGLWVPETWLLAYFLSKVGSPEEIFRQIEAGVSKE